MDWQLVLRISRRHPALASWLASIALASLWTFMWLAIFFVTTLIFDLTTAASIMLLTLWFSVIAEAPIRYFENSDFVAKMTKPHMEKPQGDNQDYKARHALGFSLFGVCVFGGVLLCLHLVGIKPDEFANAFGTISGPTNDPNLEITLSMFSDWSVVFSNQTLWIIIGLCIFVRSLIYKRKVRRSEIRQLNSSIN